MLQYFTSLVRAVFCGAQGVKQIRLGGEAAYTRPGGFFYLMLKSEE